jgi:hypothetical protein
MPQKGLDPLQEGLPAAVVEVVAELREIYNDGPYERLKQVEDAIVAVRTGRPELVTVSSATCSRMLSPRRTSGGGRTALPRWPSVLAFLVVHGHDPAPYEERWQAARAAWVAQDGPRTDELPADPAAGDDPERLEPPGSPEPAGAAPDPGSGTQPAPGAGPAPGVDEPRPAPAPAAPASSRRRRPLLVAGAGVAALALVGVGILIGRALPPRAADPAFALDAEPLHATSVASAVPVPAGSAGTQGVHCVVPDGDPGVHFVRVAAVDGLTDVGADVRVDLLVAREPEPGNTYWLMVLPPAGRGPYVAETPVPTTLGPTSIVLRSASPIGAARNLFVAEATPDADRVLQENHRHEADASWDPLRAEMPAGTRTVSGTCQVARTR